MTVEAITAAPSKFSSHWRSLRADLARMKEMRYSSPWSSAGFWAVTIYRLQCILRDGEPKWLLFPPRAVLAILRRFVSLITGIQISADARIGPGLLVPHPGSIWIDAYATLGSGCTVYHGVTLGEGPTGKGARIGDNVILSCQCSVIGRVNIGNGALVAANTLVIYDVPAGATAIGVPAKIIPGKPAVTKPSV